MDGLHVLSFHEQGFYGGSIETRMMFLPCSVCYPPDGHSLGKLLLRGFYLQRLAPSRPTHPIKIAQQSVRVPGEGERTTVRWQSPLRGHTCTHPFHIPSGGGNDRFAQRSREVVLIPLVLQLRFVPVWERHPVDAANPYPLQSGSGNDRFAEV